MSDEQRTVVGAVITETGRVLAARRTGPSELAGYWEFPGGKVEPGEDPRRALAREVEEELAAAIVIGDELEGGPWTISDKYVLRLFSATVAEREIRPGADHDELRWLALDDLDSVQWLPSDRAALSAVRSVLVLSVRE